MKRGYLILDNLDWIYALIAGVFGYCFGGFDVFFQVLIFFMVLDVIAGFMKATKGKGKKGDYVKSSTFLEGLGKKFVMIITVAFSVQLDKILGGTDIIRTMVVNLLLFNEAISIIENIGAYGIKLPKKVMEMLEVLKHKDS